MQLDENSHKLNPPPGNPHPDQGIQQQHPRTYFAYSSSHYPSPKVATILSSNVTDKLACFWTLYKWNQWWYICTWLPAWLFCLWESTMLFHVALVCSFLLLCIPLYDYTTMYLSILLFIRMGILHRMLLWTIFYVSSGETWIFISLGHTPRRGDTFFWIIKAWKGFQWYIINLTPAVI